MARLRYRETGELSGSVEQPLGCHSFQVHSGPEWQHLSTGSHRSPLVAEVDIIRSFVLGSRGWHPRYYDVSRLKLFSTLSYTDLKFSTVEKSSAWFAVPSCISSLLRRSVALRKAGHLKFRVMRALPVAGDCRSSTVTKGLSCAVESAGA